LQNPAPEIFHGRGVFIEQAVGMLVNEPAARLAVLGPGGIGKTSIALTMLHAGGVKSKFEGHSRFVSCEGLTCALLVDTLCIAFGLHKHSKDRLQDLLVFLMGTYTIQPLLLILDNFETLWDADFSETEALLKALGQVPLLSLIITMRGTEYPGGLQWTKPLLTVVGKIDAVAAHNVFLDICGCGDDKLDELL